ncbi:tetratricopeptide repeat protein [Azospirillum sp.]|uniref:tetratricopeptide repeat protein n=1 Tax=Azospirillum sp. TaxID=34012 RepID=UPI003D73EDB8
MPNVSDESIPPKLIEDALERVLASRGFRGSTRKRRFLKFVVDETQAGHADRIKAFTIAMDVFDRDANFDPLIDPVVRIQAGRIRRCLEQYYLTEGALDPIQITIPKGGYVPRFIVKQEADPVECPDAFVDPEPPAAVGTGAVAMRPAAAGTLMPGNAPARSLRAAAVAALKRYRVVAGAVAGAVLLSLLAAVWFSAPAPHPAKGEKLAANVRGPALLVLPFTNGTGNPAQDVFVEGFTEDLIGALIRFRNVFVFGARTTFRFGSETALRRARVDTNIDYVLKGSVNQVGDQIQITVALIDANDQRYVWSNGYRGTFNPSNMIDVRQDIAVQVAGALAQSNGVIDKEELRATATLSPTALSSYECMLRTRRYWRQPTSDLHGQVRTCLERATQTDPLYADAWAALAIAYIDEARLGFNPVKSRPDPIASGLRLAEHAATLAPDSPLPHKAVALAHWLRHEPGRSIAAYETALALNPNDSDVLADLGRSYSLVGEWEKGIPLIREAFARNPAHPDWYRITFALYHYMNGRYDEALAEAKRVDQPALVYAHVVLAMIYGQTGRAAEAAYEVGEILRLEPDFASKAASEFERRNINPSTIAMIVDGLQKAGLAIAPQWASSDGR